MFAPCINDNYTLYYPTNAQYIICRYNLNYKIFKSAPTCFGSQRIHHQGALYSAWLKIVSTSYIILHYIALYYIILYYIILYYIIYCALVG